MRRILVLLLALLLALPSLAAFAESDEQDAVKAISALVKTALKSEDCFYRFADGDPCYYTVTFEPSDNRLGDMDVYLDVYSWGVLIWASYEEAAPEDRIDEIAKFMNMVNGELLYRKYLVETGSGRICYELAFFMDARDLRDYEFTMLISVLNGLVADFDYDVDYFTEIIRGETAENAFAMWLADYYRE